MKKFVKKPRSKKASESLQQTRFFLRHPLILPTSIFIGLFFIGLIMFVALGGSTQGARDAFIVDVFVDGQQRTVTTRADTIGELAERMQLNLTDEDIVEPAREELILEDDVQVNVYRARPVQLVEEDRIITAVSAQQSPRLIAAEAGIELVSEDKIEPSSDERDVLVNGVSEQFVITRSVPVRLSLYGVLKPVRTTANDVAGFLSEQGISPEADENIQPARGAAITKDMLIAVNKPGVLTEAVEETIDFEIETKDDETITAGESQTEREGAPGLRAVIYEITTGENGEETARRELETVVLQEPLSEVRLRGTKIETPVLSPTLAVSGDKAALMAAAGIAPGDYSYVDYIISKESGWRPGANNSYSGAYGLCQALPASKMSSAGADYLTNPVTQLRWCSGYASGRYGGWGGAYSAWQVQNWW